MVTVQLVLDSPKDLDQLMDLYDNTLSDLINKHAPLRVRQMPQRPLIPWRNNNVQTAKRHYKQH